MSPPDKRSYNTVSIRSKKEGEGVWLDDAPAKTPRGHALILPTRALAEAVTAEWQAQGKRIVPDTMPMTRLSCIALDVVPANRDILRAEILGYGETDQLCFRETEDQKLLALHQQKLQPVVQWAEEQFAVQFALSYGVKVTPHPQATLDALKEMLAERNDTNLSSIDDVTLATRRKSAAFGSVFDTDSKVNRYDFELAALSLLVKYTASLILTLALLYKRTDIEETIALSQLDETYQAEKWGQDEEATAKRAHAAQEMRHAYHFLTFLAA